MNREIKFRAWDGKNKRWVPAKELTLGAWPSQHSENVEWFLETEDSEELPTTGYELVQFTGLRDKNGKEIYEGDIIKTEYIGMDEKPHVWCSPVIYRGQGFELGGKQISSNPIMVISQNRKSEQEVIGNIYENPELLTK